MRPAPPWPLGKSGRCQFCYDPLTPGHVCPADPTERGSLR